MKFCTQNPYRQFTYLYMFAVAIRTDVWSVSTKRTVDFRLFQVAIRTDVWNVSLMMSIFKENQK